MSSNIDQTKPTAGSALTADVRNNFDAAKNEINELHRITVDSVASTGTADALIANFTKDVVLAEGVVIIVKATAANTSATPTLNVDGTGAKTIVKNSGSALGAGDIAGNRHYCIFKYDATNLVWVLMNPAITSASINHNNTTGFVANEHIDHTAVSINPGTGLTGGGTIAANRTLSLDINSLTTNNTPDVAADYIPFYDTSAGGIRKAIPQNFSILASSLASDGYVKFANGLIIQWGTRSYAGGTTVTVTLPVAFTTAVYGVIAGPAAELSFSTDGYSGYAWKNGSSLTSIRVTTDLNIGTFWIAIGK